MRIDVRDMPWEAGRWFVWHVEWCRPMPLTVWVDDETAQYGKRSAPRLEPVTHQARRIQILMESRTIMFNPLDDATMLESEVEEVKKEVNDAGVPA